MADITTTSFNIPFLLSIFEKPLAFPLTFVLLAIPIFLHLKRNFLVKHSKKTEYPLPPGPRPWPVFGCLLHIAINKPAFKWIHKVMEQMKTEILCIRLGKVHVIAVTSPEISRECLQKQDLIFASRPEMIASCITTRGYKATSYTAWGAQWKKMRRVMTAELFSAANHRWYYSKRVEEADHLTRYIYNQCKLKGSGLVDVRYATQHYCANLIRRMVFNKRFFGKVMEDGGPGPEEEEHLKALFTILAYIHSFSISDYMPFLRKLDLDGHEKVIMWTDEIMKKYQDPLIDQRIQQWKDGVKKEVVDLLDTLITLKDENGNPLLTSEEIKAQITEIMIAAVDNPSIAAEWALAEMINKPEIMQKAVSELDSVVGRERLVQESDFPKLNYVKACARESFRLHPVAPFNVPHISTADTVVANYFIPKGSVLLLSRSGLGRNPRVWEDPYTFKPERHLDDQGSEVLLTEPDLRFISFGIGRRGCLAVNLGTSMTLMLFARLLHGFTWMKPPDVPKIDLSEEKTGLFLAKPLVAMAKPRLPAHVYPAFPLD